jgi:hypothetical protein
VGIEKLPPPYAHAASAMSAAAASGKHVASSTCATPLQIHCFGIKGVQCFFSDDCAQQHYSRCSFGGPNT